MPGFLHKHAAMNLRQALMLLAVFTVAGCTMGPDYERPEVAVPGNFRGAGAGGDSFGDVEWESVFPDPVLRSLVRESLVNNRDLAVAVARVEEARAYADLARTDFFPRLDGTVKGNRVRQSDNGLFAPFFPTHINSFDVLGLLSYEVDIWGRVRRGNEAARARALSTEYARRGMETFLVAAVASTYIDLRAADRKLAITRRTLATRKESYGLVQTRADEGAASDLDLRQAEVLLRQAEVAVPAVEQGIRAKEHELCLLLGRNPGSVARGRALEKLGIRMSVPAGLPSRLLERRPDILAVEQQLVAANADIGVARAAYFPKLRLTASGGISSIEFDQFVDAGSRTWSMTTALAGPIFDAGKTRLGVKAREAKQAQILASYEKAIQTGFREVADALNAVEKSRRIVDRQEALVHALSKVAELARTRYKEGAATYLEVLDAERQRFDGEIKLADARRMQLKAVVQTYKALGGGWKEE